MFARGGMRFVLSGIFVVVTIYLFATYSRSLPSDWSSSLRSSAAALYPISKDSPAYPNEDFSTDQPVSNPKHPVAAADAADLDRVADEVPIKDSAAPSEADVVNELPNKQETPLIGQEEVDLHTDAEKTKSSDPPASPVKPSQAAGDSGLPPHYIYNDVAKVHRTVKSLSTRDQKYFPIVFGKANAYNPNVIPHRKLNDTYIIVAQESEHSVEDSLWFSELLCNAKFKDGKLQCLNEPKILSIAATFGDKCVDDLTFFRYNVGPHDARVFYGPTKPLVLYGSNSAYTCFGQFVQDLRVLLDWGFEWDVPKEFRAGTEIQRPDKYGPIEKNFFLFWDVDNEIYAHYDLAPKRVFAKLNDDGSVGPDLGPVAGDDKCLKAHMPAVAETLESIHQATNSLSITLCKRHDTACVADEQNTFVFHLFHHKSYYAFHSNYEPYVMLFHQTAPFSIHAIGKKPLWIHGRGLPGEAKRPHWVSESDNWRQTEMFYITSISWAAPGQTYHGYLDDTLFINFGIEDHLTGGIDVRAEELFLDLGLCADA